MKTQILTFVLCYFSLLSLAQNSCYNALQLNCGETYIGNTNTAENNFVGTDYGCIPASFTFEGKDMVFAVQVPILSNELKIELFGLSEDLDLIVFAGSCTPSNCVNASTASGTSTETITIQNPSGWYYIVVDGYSAGYEGAFSLSTTCDSDCVSIDLGDCEELGFNYAGNNGSLNYHFFHTNNTSGDWTVQQKGNNTSSTTMIGTGASINYTFGGVGEYEICHYTTNDAACYLNCCKTIYAYDPTYCSDINIQEQGNQINLFTNAWQTTTLWADTDSGNTIAGTTNGISINKPADGTCRSISAYLYDEDTNCHRLCIQEICSETSCPEEDNHCFDIDYAYSGTNGALRYFFKIANTQPGGYWTTERIEVSNPADFYTANLGATQSITHTFPTAGTYRVCYIYTDENGCDIICSRNMLIQDPATCGFISRNFNTQNGTWTLNWNDVDAAQPERWNNVTTGQALGTFTNNVTTAAPLAGECHKIRVMYFDTICARYGVCETEICTDNLDNCACVSSPSDLTWLNTLKNRIEGSCNLGGEARIKTAKLNGKCVYLIQNFLLDDLLTALYDCDGNLICERNPLYDTNCNALDQVSDEHTIWECNSNNSGECISRAAGTLACNDEQFEYSFQLTNNQNEIILAQFIVAYSGVSFTGCYNVEDYLAAPGNNTVTLSFENCNGSIPVGTEVTIFAQYIDTNQKICFSEDFSIILVCDNSGGDDDFCVGTGGNLVSNGDFEGGYWGFESSLSQACWCSEDTYCIDTNAQNKCSQNGTATMDNKFLIVEKGQEDDGAVWRQAVSIQQGQTYSFSFDLLGFAGAASTELRLAIAANTVKVVSTEAGLNKRVGISWVATYTGTANLEIVHRYAVGNTPYRFGIDNIEFVKCGIVNPDTNASTFSTNNEAISSPKIALSNAPNPFSDFTSIRYRSDEETTATLRIFDINGRIITRRTEQVYEGENTFQFEAQSLPSGTYFYEVQTAQQRLREKMVIQ